MAFSLRKKLQEATAQINPFDHGQTASTVARGVTPAPAAQLPLPGTQNLARSPGFMSKVAARASQTFDQVNPLDNGRTYQQRNPVNNRSLISQSTHNGITNTAGNFVVKPTIDWAKSGARSVYDIGRGAAASVTNNKAALQNAQRAKETDFSQFLPSRQLAQLGETVVHPFAKHTITPGTSQDRRLFGTAPISNIQGDVANAYNATKGQSGINRLKTGLLTAGIDIAGDVGSLYGAKAAGHTFAREGITAGKTAANTAQEIVTRKPFRNISDDELAVAGKVRSSMQGLSSPMDLTDQDVRTYRNIQNKLGTNMNDHDAVDAVLGARRTYDTNMSTMRSPAVSQGGFIRLPSEEPGNNQVISDQQQVPLPNVSPGTFRPPIPEERMTPIQSVIDNKRQQMVDVSTAPIPAEGSAANGKPLPIPGDIPTANGGNVKRTRFTSKTVQNSDEVSPEVKSKTDASYTADTMKAAAKRSNEYIDTAGEQKALEHTLGELNTKRGTASRDTIDRALELAARHDAKGTEVGADTAARLYNLAGEHASASGQASQVLSRIARRSPAGLRNKAFRDLKEYGDIDVLKTNEKQLDSLEKQQRGFKPGSPDHIRLQKQIDKLTAEDEKRSALKRDIQDQIDAIGKMPDGQSKDFAVAVLQKNVAKHIKQNALDNVVSVWKAGLLSGSKTSTGNILSNATFAGLKKASDVTSAAADRVISLANKGKRTKVLTNKGIASGTKEGIRNAGTTLKTGVDVRNIGDKYEQHSEINFNNKFIQKVFGDTANGVFRLMGAADQPFYYAQFKNSLYDMAKADGINKGLRGSELRQHMNDLVKNPTEQMVSTAEKEANKAVLNYDTFASKAVAGAHRGIDNMKGVSDAGKAAAHTAINVLAPFVRVPSAFISRTTDFTPLGIPKEVFSQIAHKQFDQRALSQAIGEAMTGTGVIALGIALARSKMLSGDYPSDPKEQQRWRAEGIQPNAVKLGNKWFSLNYLGPVGLLFNAGRQVEEAKGESAMTKAGAAVGGLGQGLLGQSFLQGFSGFTNAITDPERSAKSFINSEASSVVPSFSNDIANATDKKQRQADTPLESIKNRLPGLREQNKIKQDVYGNELAQNNQGVAVVNPLKPSQNITSPTLAEVKRLHDVDPKDKNLQVTPTTVARNIKVDGKIVTLNNNQRYALQKTVGQAIQENWSKLIQTPEYKALDDQQKVRALNNLRSDTAELAQRTYVTTNKLGTYIKDPDRSVQALGTGDTNIADYATNAINTGMSSRQPISKGISKSSHDFLTKYNVMSDKQRDEKSYRENDFDYKLTQAQYENNIAKGKYSKAQKIKAQDVLTKAKVGADFTKDTRELYGLSKDDLYAYVSTDPNGKRIAQNVLAYGDALEKAGVSTNKFRDSKGNEAIRPKDKSSGSSGRGKTSFNLYSDTAGSASGFDKKLRSILEKARLS